MSHVQHHHARHRRRPHLAVSAMALATTSLAWPALAPMEAQAQAQEARLAPITVTATGNPVEAFAFPGQVSIVERDEIEAVMPSTVEETLRSMPGVDFDGGPRRTGQVPTVRGFSGPDVVILFDGVRQSFNSGHDGRFFIDPFILRRVEVVKGPTSALYGSGGLGGTMEFRTIEAGDLLDPGDGSAVRLGGAYATANGEDRYGVIGTTRIGRSEALAAFTYRDAGDIRLGDGSDLRNNEQVRGGLLKGSHSFAPGHDLQLSWQGFRNDATELNNPQGIGSGGLVDKDVTNDTFRAGYRFRPDGSNWLDLGITGGYARNQVEEEVLTGDGASPIGTDLKREVDSYTLRLDNRTRLGLGQNSSALLTYGVEGFLDSQDGASSATADGEREGVPDADATTFAGFVQGELTFETGIGKVLVVLGLRFDYFENDADGYASKDASELSPKLGVTYQPTEPATRSAACSRTSSRRF
jgi:hemoglobin/transferrin/lactoferrin receptor protein